MTLAAALVLSSRIREVTQLRENGRWVFATDSNDYGTLPP